MKETSVLLKVFTGERWKRCWYRFSGRKIPEDALILSPTVCMKGKQAYLHIPIEKVVRDIRTVAKAKGKKEKIEK